MTDKPSATGRPAAVQTLNGRPVPGKPVTSAPSAPRSITGSVKAKWGDLVGQMFVSSGRHYFQFERPGGGRSTIRFGAHDVLPRAVVGGINCRQRPGALPIPAERGVAAFTPAPVLDRWNSDAAGIRPASLGLDDNVITMFDVIGEDWWTGGGVTAKKVASQLRAIGDRPVEVQINSPGGDMFEGLAIYNVLREHPQAVTIKVMGMAASAASVIAMAGDSVEIGAASFIMIHNCWVGAVGNRHDMLEVAAFLAPFDQAMADVYAQRTGKTATECAKWMDDETYMSGSVAIERGFADELLSADKTTVDEKAKATDTAVNKVRAMELALVAGGATRAQARAHINEIKGTPGAALDPADTPGAGGDLELTSLLAGLLSTIGK